MGGEEVSSPYKAGARTDVPYSKTTLRPELEGPTELATFRPAATFIARSSTHPSGQHEKGRKKDGLMPSEVLSNRPKLF